MIGEITVDVHHLKIFFEACKEKSFTKAAKNLFISQFAVSIQIKKLETTLGVTLIERDSKNFKLTFAGKELYRLAQQVFNRISRMENEMFKIIKENKFNTYIISLALALITNFYIGFEIFLFIFWYIEQNSLNENT